MEERHGKLYVDRIFRLFFERGVTIQINQKRLSKISRNTCSNTILYGEEITKLIQNDSGITFSMCDIFKIEQGKFVNEIYIKNVLDLLAGSKNGKTKTDNFFARIRDISNKLKSRTTLDSQNFTSQIWFLPANCGSGTSVTQLLKLVKPLLENHPILSHYEILSVKETECEKNIKGCIRKFEKQGKATGKIGLIILTGKQISLGISLPCVDVVVMLNDDESFDWNYQRMFRALTESENKKIGFVVDFHPSRIMSTFYNYTSFKKRDLKKLGKN